MSVWIVSIWLLCMSVPDIRSKHVPGWLIGAGAILALVVSVIEKLPEVAGNGNWMNCVGSVVCGILPGVALLLLWVATKTVGSGDGVVLTILGAVVGFQKSVLILCMSLFLAALSSVVLLVLKKVNRKTCLPFLPFLTIGWFLVQAAW